MILTLRKNQVILASQKCIPLLNFISFHIWYLVYAGSFGTATLQLPVEGGHEGGCATITFRGVTKMLDSHQNSDKSFYLSAFYGNCDYSIEPITRGWGSWTFRPRRSGPGFQAHFLRGPERPAVGPERPKF